MQAARGRGQLLPVCEAHLTAVVCAAVAAIHVHHQLIHHQAVLARLAEGDTEAVVRLRKESRIFLSLDVTVGYRKS